MPEETLPLSPQVFHILLALTDAPAHGYAIMQAVEQETDGAIQLGPGTLYGAIRRLRADGLIEEIDQQGDAARRCYRLTTRGRNALKREARRLAQLVESARARRLLPGRLS
ncbi:MAG TPA: PadR family transcriptional regulator [Longimicrobiales bacterium]|nr:PadR family transcriptional regulator [Longimicrobiales bacterium]